MGAEEAAAAEAAADAAWEQGMKEFADLQEWLLFRTWRFGLLFSGYLLLAASGEARGRPGQLFLQGCGCSLGGCCWLLASDAVSLLYRCPSLPLHPPLMCRPFRALQAAFCELIGTAAGYGYFKWLIADVSKLQPGDRIPMVEAGEVEHVPRTRLAALPACLFGAPPGRHEGSLGAAGLPAKVPRAAPLSLASLRAPPTASLAAPRQLRPWSPPAGKVEPQLARWGAKLLAAYRTALQPRLLVLPGLLAAAAAYNAAAGPEDQLGLVEQGCLLGGFLSWKVRPAARTLPASGACGATSVLFAKAALASLARAQQCCRVLAVGSLPWLASAGGGFAAQGMPAVRSRGWSVGQRVQDLPQLPTASRSPPALASWVMAALPGRCPPAWLPALPR